MASSQPLATMHILIEARVRKKMNVAPITRFFKDIAKLAVQRMDKELDAKQGTKR